MRKSTVLIPGTNPAKDIQIPPEPPRPPATAHASWMPIAGGKMGELLRTFDWQSTPLGPLENWPQSLRLAVGICMNSRFPMFVWWGPQLINIYNDAYAPMLGKRHPAAFGRPAQPTWNDIWHIVGPQAQAVMQHGQATWNERVLLVMERHGYSEDTWFTWSYSPIPDEAGGVGGVYCACFEDTPRIRAEQGRDQIAQELLETRARLESMLANIADFTYSFDLDGRFTYVNKPLLDLWGLTLDEALGKNFHDLRYPDTVAEKLQQQIQQVITTGHPVTDETPYTSPTGVGGYYQYIFSPVFGAGGAVEAVAGSTRDITTIKAAEHNLRRISAEKEQLLLAEQAARAEAEAANRAKDKFLAVLSHELRTPLSPVVMTIPAIEADPELPAKFRADLAMVRRNIDLEVKLIDDLLDLSRVTTGKLRLHMQPVRIHEVLRHAIQNSMSDSLEKQITMLEELLAVNDCVTADPARLQQVFWNLLRNAVKFTPSGGTITVRTWNNEEGQACLNVRDTGVGIASDMLSRVFDAFEQGDSRVTRQFGGLGLGLAIVKTVVEMHGGTVSAWSDGRDQGSTFTVRLATVAKTEAADASHDTSEQETAPQPSQYHVLLVEDHPDTVSTLARLLRYSGLAVKTAGSVTAALQLAALEHFDVLVSDIGLPDATGYELMKQIRDRHGIKGIALSGYGMEEDMRKSREVGFVEHIIKPVNFPQLEAAIRRVIGIR